MHFDQSIATNGLIRLRLTVTHDGLQDVSYGYGAELQIRKGWNDGCEMNINTLSVEELRSLHYLIGRVISMVKDG